MTTGPNAEWTASDWQALLRQFAWPLDTEALDTRALDTGTLETGALDTAAQWRLQPWGSSQGFSSAHIWRLERPCSGSNGPGSTTPATPQAWCLRAWPAAHSDESKLKWIHEQILRAAPFCPFLLAPLPVLEGAATWTPWRGRLWQVEPWATGQNDYLIHPSPTRLAAVMQALATLHHCWLGGLDHGPNDGSERGAVGVPSGIRRGVSPSLNRRLEQWEDVRRHGSQWLTTARHHLRQTNDQLPEEAERWRHLLLRIEQVWRQQDRPGQAQLAAAANQTLPLGPVLADVWSDHLFFDDQRLTAIIDYGGMRVDSVAADLSRCLSSLCGQDAALRALAWQDYDQHRGLTAAERLAVEAFDRSSQLLGPWHWVRWLFVEARFPLEPRIRTRVERLVAGQPF